MINEPFLINPIKHGCIEENSMCGNRYGHKNNPGEILVIGGNPMRRKKRAASKTTKHTGSISRNHKRRRGTALPANPPKRRRYRRRVNAATLASNPRRARRYRRNPASRGMNLAVPSLRRPVSLIAPIAVGLGGAVITDQVPGILGLSGYMAKASQAGAILGGGMLINGLLGPVGMAAWVVGGGIVLLKDFVSGMLFPSIGTGIVTTNGSGTSTGTMQGFGNLPVNNIGYPASTSRYGRFGGFGAFPRNFGAYPNQMY